MKYLDTKYSQFTVHQNRVCTFTSYIELFNRDARFHQTLDLPVTVCNTITIDKIKKLLLPCEESLAAQQHSIQSHGLRNTAPLLVG